MTDDIQTGLDRIWSSDFVQKNPKKSYQAYHPDEYNRVKAYVEGGAEPTPWPTTLLGDGLCLVERGRRGIGTPDPPPPEPDTYTYRFATFNTSTDKITGCLNRFPPTYSWWVPGTAERSPWPKGGGIFPVFHAQHGPGLNLLLTDEMLYGNVAAGTGPKDSNVVRYVMEPNLIDERLRVPAAGSIHTWECTIMRPPGTWPNGFYECVWEQGTDNGYGANVGHHIFLNNNGRFPGWSYYFGRQNGSGPLGGTYWQFYNAPVPFNAGEYHTIRWEFKWTAPGVPDGYLKTWIGVDGGAMQPWLDLQNIATQISGFKQHYTQMVTIRTPRNVLTHPNLSLHVHNMRVKIA